VSKIKSKIKSYKNNKSTQILSNSQTWHKRISEEAFMLFPEKNSWRRRLIYTMFIWAEKEDSLELEQFCLQYKLSRKTLYEWREKHTDIKDAVDEVKLILGSRRRIGAMTKKYDSKTVFRDMHRYDPDWIEINKYWADLKNGDTDTDGKPKVIVVKIPQYISKESTK
jgi:hypothetical protein